MFIWRNSFAVRQAALQGQIRHICPSSRSYSVQYEQRSEDVTVTCGSSGEIRLNIYNYDASESPSPRPIILYFPPLTVNNTPHSPPKALFSGNTTLIQINPRWSSSNPFPTPVHDTLFAYDWILENLLPPAPTSAFPRIRTPPTPIGIYGSLLGGSLAASLALTESRKKQPNERSRIAALAISNSIFDFSTLATSIAQISEPSASDSVSTPESQKMKLLSDLLPTLFTNPAQAFDPFVSPILFFRTTGLSIPRSWNTSAKTEYPSPPASPESPVASSQPLSTPPAWADLEFDPEFDPPSSFPEYDFDDPSYHQNGGRRQEELPIYPPSRKAHLRFPATASNLVLPMTRIHVGGKGSNLALLGSHGLGDEVRDVMMSQAQEFCGLIRRSVRLNELKNRVLWDEDVDVDGEAEARAAVLGDGDGNGVSGGLEGEWAREWLVDRGVLL